MHRLIARRVRRDPSLVTKAKENVFRWQQSDHLTPSAEWLPLLNGSLDQLLRIMKDKSEQSQQLRQSSPFAGNSFIQQSERMKILAHHRK